MAFQWIVQQEGFFHRYKLIRYGRLILCLNSAPPEERYWLRQRRPSLYPFLTPLGVPVTEQGGHTMPHHKSVWLAHGNVNGVNFYTDEPDTGLIQTVEAVFREENDTAAIDTRVLWVDPRGTTVIEEVRKYRVRCSDQVNRVDVESVMTTPLSEAVFAQDHHSLFSLRPIDLMSEDQGGVMVASNGKRGAQAIDKTEGLWIDLRGKVGPVEAGAALMVHPDNGPQGLFARNYGTIAISPTYFASFTLKKGASWRQVYSAAAYDCRGNFNAETIFDEFVKTCHF